MPLAEGLLLCLKEAQGHIPVHTRFRYYYRVARPSRVRPPPFATFFMVLMSVECSHVSVFAVFSSVSNARWHSFCAFSEWGKKYVEGYEKPSHKNDTASPYPPNLTSSRPKTVNELYNPIKKVRSKLSHEQPNGQYILKAGTCVAVTSERAFYALV